MSHSYCGGRYRLRLRRSLSGPMPVAEMKVARGGTLRETVRLRAIGCVIEAGEAEESVAK